MRIRTRAAVPCYSARTLKGRENPSRSRQKLVSDREGFGNHGREVRIEFSLAAIFNEKALPLAGTSQLRLDRQDDRMQDCEVCYNP